MPAHCSSTSAMKRVVSAGDASRHEAMSAVSQRSSAASSAANCRIGGVPTVNHVDARDPKFSGQRQRRSCANQPELAQAPRPHRRRGWRLAANTNAGAPARR